MRRRALLLFVAACGGTSSGPPPAPAQSAISAVAPPAGADDVEVARVNGRPVWGSCVAEQATRHRITRADALEQCIAFELMAQEAEQRQLATTPEVAELTRDAMVSRLVATTFEATYATPADLGDFMTRVLDKNAWRMHRPDVRTSLYVRLNHAAGAPEQEAQRQAIAQQIHDALANERGLMEPHVHELVQRIAGDNPALEVKSVPLKTREGLDAVYGDALYAIPEVGGVAGPVRTRWGWDVIMWTGGLPPKETSREELAAELFPDVRRAYFQTWVAQLMKDRGVVIETHPEQLEDEGGAP